MIVAFAVLVAVASAQTSASPPTKPDPCPKERGIELTQPITDHRGDVEVEVHGSDDEEDDVPITGVPTGGETEGQGGGCILDSNPARCGDDTGQVRQVPEKPVEPSSGVGACPPTGQPGYVYLQNNICEWKDVNNDAALECVCEISLRPPGSMPPPPVYSPADPVAYPGGFYIADARDGVIKYSFWDANGNKLPRIEIRKPDGSIYRYEEINIVPNVRSYKLVEALDSHDNTTKYEWDVNGRLTEVHRPDGITESWNYAPSWIDNAIWHPANYSGIEITYYDHVNLTSLPELTWYLLFKKNGGGPLLGDLLYRKYAPRADYLADTAALGGQLYDESSKAVGHSVYQFTYEPDPNQVLIERVEQFIAGSILPNTEGPSETVREFEWVLAGDRKRVQKETVSLTGEVYTFTYTVDPAEDSRVLESRRTASDGTVLITKLDDHQRPTEVTTIPTNDSDGRPRAFDTDNGGHEEPTQITLKYEYSDCISCESRPTKIEHWANGSFTGRSVEYDYDAITGYVTEERVMDPSDGVGHVATTYEWSPLVPGDTKGAYKLDKVTTPDGEEWNYTYTLVPRFTPAGQLDRGKKIEFELVDAPTVSSGSAIPQAATQYDVSSPVFMSSGGQQRWVGFVKAVVDHDGVNTTFEHDTLLGHLTGVVRNPLGGNDSVEVNFVNDRLGRPLTVTTNVGSSLSQVTSIVRDDAGRVSTVVANVGSQTVETRSFYDRWGNVCVSQRRNENASGSAPDDYGPTPRAEAARTWLRDEFHCIGNRLSATFEDRRPLDRDSPSADPLVDAAEARYLLTVYDWTRGGFIKSISHPNGSETVFTYDGYQSLYKVEHKSIGQPTVLDRKLFVNDVLEVVRVFRGDSNLELATTIERNASGRVERVTEPEPDTPPGYTGPPTYAKHEFDADQMGRITEVRVVDALTTSVVARETRQYDEVGRPWIRRAFDPSVPATPLAVHTTEWEGMGKVKKVTDPAGRFVERSYDALARLTQIKDSLPNNPNLIDYEYEAKTNLVKRVVRTEWDELSSAAAVLETSYEYDGLGRVSKILDGPSGFQLEHEFAYYSSGFTEWYQDPEDKVFRYLPDATGRLVEKFLPGTVPIWNESRYKDWTGLNDRTEVVRTDGRGRVTRSIHDFFGRLQSVMNPGAATEPTSTSPSQPLAEYFVYDAASRLTGVHQGDDVFIALYRDGMGRLLVRSTPSAGANQFVSFYHGRDILIRNALGQVTYAANLYGADGGGGSYHQEALAPDSLGRNHRESFKFLLGDNWVDIESGFSGGDQVRSSLTYDNNAGGDGLWLDYTPDAVGRLGQVDWRTTSGGTPEVLAEYKHQGGRSRQRATHWAAGGSSSFDTNYRYDVSARVDRITQSFGASATVEFSYDDASNLLKEEYQKQGGASQKGDRFAYDEHHRLESAWLGADQPELNSPGTGTFVEKLTYGLDTGSNRDWVTTQLGVGGALTTADYETQDAPPQGPSNRYSDADGVAPLYDERGNTIFDGNFCYVYDDLNRLTEVYILTGEESSSASTSPSSGPAASAPSLSSLREAELARGQFEVASVEVLRIARSRILGRIPGALNLLLERQFSSSFREGLSESIPIAGASRTTSGSSSASSASMSSPQSGSQEGATMTLYALYQYDAMNRRVHRTRFGWQTWFTAWDDWREVEELVWNGTNVVPQRQFVWGEQLDELIAYRFRQPGTGPGFADYFVAEGGAHCPSRILDDSGNVVEIQEYSPYGAVSHFSGAGVPRLGSDGAVGNVFGWKGHRWDPETGLFYARNRYYSSAWGRFLTLDPIGVWGDVVQRGNGYAYGAASPLTNSDPLGLQVSSTHAAWAKEYGMKPGDSVSFAETQFLPVSGKPYEGLRMFDDGRVAPISADGAIVLTHWMDELSPGDLAMRDIYHLIDGASFNLSHAWGPSVEPETLGEMGLQVAGSFIVPTGALAKLAHRAAKLRKIWNMGPLARGLILERWLGANLPQGFRIFDRLSKCGKIITSIKTIKLSSPSYQNPNRLRSLIMGYVNKVRNASGTIRQGRTSINVDGMERGLHIGLDSVGTPGQQRVLADILETVTDIKIEITVLR